MRKNHVADLSNKKMSEEQNRFSLRKLSVGLASVLVGVSIFSTSQTVKADTLTGSQASTVTNNVQSSDTQENGNAAKSSFSSDNQANNTKSNLIQIHNDAHTVVKDNDATIKGNDAVIKTDAKSSPEGQSQPPEAVKKDSGVITQDIKQDAVNTKAKQQNAAVHDSDAVGDKTLKTKAEATKKAVAVVLRADSSETTLNLNGTNAIDPQTLKDNKIEAVVKADPARGIDPVKFASNGGFDPEIWGTMDTSKWQLDNNGNITGYTGDMSHIIIPNSADFAKAGKNYSQIGISSGEMQLLGGNANSKADTLAISLTDNKKVKASDANWSYTFNRSTLKQANLEGLDTSNVTIMNYMFYSASSLNSLDVTNWDTSKVTSMHSMFEGASSLTSLDVSNWKTSEVTDMYYMFNGVSSLTSLDVSKWDTSKVTNMSGMFWGASSLTSLDVSTWDTGNVTNMSYMFSGASSLTSLDVSKWNTGNVTYFIGMYALFNHTSKLALIANGDKFADYLVKNNFAYSGINSDVKSVTTDNTKLLQLLTNDSQHDSATRTIVFTFPANYSPDLAKYHLTKNGNTYQIKQSADYDKPYLQGTVLINATGDITEHHIDTTKPNKLSDTWQPNYDKLVLAHKNSDGSVSFDAIQLPKVPGYKAHLVRNKINPVSFMVSFVAIPTENKPSTPIEETPSKPSVPADNPNKPADDLKPRAVTELNNNDSGWTMPDTKPSTYKVEVPANTTIDLSDLMIAEPVHAQTRTQIHITKRFKLRKHGKKHAVKYFKHRKKTARTFKKYRL